MNLLLEFRIMNIPSQQIKLTYDIPLIYNKHIYAFARPFLMTSPSVDILYQQKAVNDCMINNITFFVRQPVSLKSSTVAADVAFYCMITGNIFLNISKKRVSWLYEGQFTYVNDNQVPLWLDLEPGIYELQQYGYNRKSANILSEQPATQIAISYPRTIFNRLHQAIKDVKQTYIHPSLRDMWIENKLRETLILLEDDHLSPQKETTDDPDVIMNTILHFINENLDTEVSIGRLAKMYYVSESTIRRNFIKKFGITFSQYLQKIRLEKGEQLIFQTNLHIHDIALQVGYKSAAAFTHAFRQYFGYTPTKTREAID